MADYSSIMTSWAARVRCEGVGETRSEIVTVKRALVLTTCLWHNCTGDFTASPRRVDAHLASFKAKWDENSFWVQTSVTVDPRRQGPRILHDAVACCPAILMTAYRQRMDAAARHGGLKTVEVRCARTLDSRFPKQL